MPPNSANDRPDMALTTCSYTPFCLIEPPPKISITLFSAGISFGSSAMVPLPKTILTGL